MASAESVVMLNSEFGGWFNTSDEWNAKFFLSSERNCDTKVAAREALLFLIVKWCLCGVNLLTVT